MQWAAQTQTKKRGTAQGQGQAPSAEPRDGLKARGFGAECSRGMQRRDSTDCQDTALLCNIHCRISLHYNRNHSRVLANTPWHCMQRGGYDEMAFERQRSLRAHAPGRREHGPLCFLRFHIGNSRLEPWSGTLFLTLKGY